MRQWPDSITPARGHCGLKTPAFKRLIVPALLIALLLPDVATASPGPRSTADAVALQQRRAALREAREAQFRRADTNGNRRLSPAEIEQGRLPRVLLQRFGEIDLDGDGELSPEELQQLADRRVRAATQPATAAGGE
ncbi:hypothetical protein E4T66_08910 [Sinimarinibacterium sp. CAU 1509]|uniref:hypothetical protein n=1 Tax=Sinimarinibacterium sp. CAU 1509 TaxID=2562283 RepID=UPI0010AC7E73|nr:hypothetical protein [Sinimarinibacterium sp. CAU 1509]TJY62325.1 hypothetical protein E4T66_08910 [Sinimarinibacterium sp. CAU 1509]